MSTNYNTRFTQSTQAIKLKDGRAIGWIENGRFIKPVMGSKHRLNQPPAWAIDADVFERQIKPNAKEIIIWDFETDILYISSVYNFDIHKGVLDRGFGRQYFLRLNRWNCNLSKVDATASDTLRKAEPCRQIPLIT
jgi:hypothetical protein